MRKFYILTILLTNYISNAQVGVGTESPKSTLEIVGINSLTSKDGVLIPRITKQQLQRKSLNTYGPDQNGTVVYVNSAISDQNGASLSQVDNIGSTGFYLFNSTLNKWILLNNPQDLRLVGNSNHVTVDGGFNSTETGAGLGSNNIAIGKANMKDIVGE